MKPLSDIQRAWQYNRSLKKRVLAAEEKVNKLTKEKELLVEYIKMAAGYNKDMNSKLTEENTRLSTEAEYWKNAYNDDFVQKAIDECEEYNDYVAHREHLNTLDFKGEGNE